MTSRHRTFREFYFVVRKVFKRTIMTPMSRVLETRQEYWFYPSKLIGLVPWFVESSSFTVFEFSRSITIFVNQFESIFTLIVICFDLERESTDASMYLLLVLDLNFRANKPKSHLNSKSASP